MKVYLVRHAKARSRSKWDGPDELRPLNARGERQAHGLQKRLENAPLRAVFSSPHLRCRETVEGVAASHGLGVEVVDCLAEGVSFRDSLELLRSLRDLPALFCSHGDLIPDLLSALGVGCIDDPAPLRCQKGSVWVLEGRGTRVAQSTYIPPLECDLPIGDPTRVAVLDLGSTTFSLLVADATRDGQILPVVRERVSLRLGAALADGPEIPESVCRDAVEAVCELRTEAEIVNADVIFPVATAAFREAANGAQLAARISRALGVEVRLLSGAEEACAVRLASRRRVGAGQGLRPRLTLDLGGGSLELVLDETHAASWDATLPLGVARLHRELVTSDPMSEREANLIRRRVRSALAPHLAALACCAPEAVLAGGTGRALARMMLARQGERSGRHIRGFRFSTPELGELGGRLRDATVEERLRMTAMQRRSADLIPTGALILTELAETLSLESIAVSDWGLREGIILQAIGTA